LLASLCMHLLRAHRSGTDASDLSSPHSLQLPPTISNKLPLCTPNCSRLVFASVNPERLAADLSSQKCSGNATNSGRPHRKATQRCRPHCPIRSQCP
jgi:hypothetical protein